MFGSSNQPLPAHEWYRGVSSEDILLEWREPAIIRRQLAAIEWKQFWKLLPGLLARLTLMGLVLVGAVVVAKVHALSAIPWSRVVVVSLILGLILGFVLCLLLLARVALLRWSPVKVRLASGGVGKWCQEPDTELHSEWADIRTAFLQPHPLAPAVQTIVLTLKDGSEAGLALPDSIEPGRVLDILREHGVLCVLSRHTDECRR